MRSTKPLGRAWLTLTLALAAHVADEALTGFLDVYNPIVRTLRARFGWAPFPVFEFGTWLTGLCVAVAALLLMTPLAYRGARVVRIAALPFSVLMLLNGAGHLAGSIYTRSWAPGATTAPLLIAASIWLLKRAYWA